MRGDIPVVTNVRVLGARTLRARFAGDRRDYDLDLSGLIARSKHFEPLMHDAETFAKIEIVDDGLGVAWPVKTKWGRLDLSGSTLRRIAEEQLPMSGADFSQWRTNLGLSLTEAAKLLGVGRRTIMGYVKRDELPPLVAIACRALARDKHLLAAHYVPVRKAARRALA
ncbi:MAG: hypothetical protein E6G96_13780 [Alphaproteobacteria bacterium]|jgi:hypothetical protein|nr:MAG: hypothetical protein E6G96_13780 [Alphaproteobacteria bacterium]